MYEVISSTYDKFKENQIQAKIDIKKENITVIGNKMGINRIIDNLISNLVKYSNGEESIKLDAQDGKAILQISNNTKSLKKEDVECIFDRFYKQYISRSSSESSGLGLVITKNLQKVWMELQMRGSLIIEQILFVSGIQDEIKKI